MGQARPIGTGRRQRVINVRNAQNPCSEGNLLCLEAVRVAGSVPTLVVVSDDRGYVPGKIDVGNKLESRFRMPLHYRPLLFCELAGFVEDFGRDDDLTNVVE